MLKRPKSGCINVDNFKVYPYKEVTSTNELLMEAGKEGAKSGTVVTAKHQTAGKGSKGRSFYSPHSGLYMSILIRPGNPVSASIYNHISPICPKLDPEDSLLITPAVACAVADAIQDYVHRPVGIKWVNDIYLDGKKVAGILTESSVDSTGERFYVIGIGVNVYPPEEGFPEEIADTATTVFKGEFDPLNLVFLRNRILDNLNRRFYQIPNRKFFEDYVRRMILLGVNVTVTPANGEEPYQAKAIGLDNYARLGVRKPSGEEVFLDSEDVSICPSSISPKPKFETNVIDISSRRKG